MSEEHQQPPIIATQHPPSRLPKSHIAQLAAIVDHLKRLTARSVTGLQRLALIRQTSKLISN
ncbi:hypothetical protein [Secundilactobacillus similis]|uniref:Uncharacterized protein n=1 Tax=Secundilactobacillus similis DSM 23365 = JCM 2765 TaxID=1423804 RepID=A0A0R2FN89_9LACO|nr:hypothetical protein [Secundilactobacillus similis]KRN26332.1 hypothetical protein FD14_GL002233 [Secundilactobacillus similis DSM 23365 = JCM 2765]